MHTEDGEVSDNEYLPYEDGLTPFSPFKNTTSTILTLSEQALTQFSAQNDRRTSSGSAGSEEDRFSDTTQSSFPLVNEESTVLPVGHISAQLVKNNCEAFLSVYKLLPNAGQPLIDLRTVQDSIKKDAFYSEEAAIKCINGFRSNLVKLASNLKERLSEIKIAPGLENLDQLNSELEKIAKELDQALLEKNTNRKQKSEETPQQGSYEPPKLGF